ncbi:MAG: substrate-binding domain-containing protein [Bifidobacteriaceae bacterium]|nr:substrate-binding domain-containing protein [Bifidobacteriaceae bacterium]
MSFPLSKRNTWLAGGAVVVVAAATVTGLALAGGGGDKVPDAAGSPSVSASPTASPSRTASATATPSPSPSPTPLTCADRTEPGYEFAYGDRECFPKIDASTATHPLALAFIKAFTGVDTTVTAQGFTKTHSAYTRLVDGEVDLILVTQPSEDELAYAEEQGVELEVTPVVREGFVFLTNPDNPVDSLTQDQIKGIYSGQITDWSQVGGPSGEIAAYQRPENSGSQTGMLELVMGDTTLMEPPTTSLVESDMDLLISAIASYDNQGGAIGYSYYYYVTAMYGTDLVPVTGRTETKLIAIDGVAPSPATISAQEYPYTTAYYIVTRQGEPADSPASLVKAAMLSTSGQQTATAAGYVPLAPDDVATGTGIGDTLYGTAPADSAIKSLDEVVAWSCTDSCRGPVYLIDSETSTLGELFLEGTDIRATLLEAVEQPDDWMASFDLEGEAFSTLASCDLELDAIGTSDLVVCGVGVPMRPIYDRLTQIFQPFDQVDLSANPDARPYLIFTELPMWDITQDVECDWSDYPICTTHEGLVADNLWVEVRLLGTDYDSATEEVLAAAKTLSEAWYADLLATAKADPSHFYIATGDWVRGGSHSPELLVECGDAALCQDTEVAVVPLADSGLALRAFGRSQMRFQQYLTGGGTTLQALFSSYTGEIDLRVDVVPVTVP